ncbi:thiol reductant ABC exporter subunit CydC [Metasolibacillus sp.]|uniref:thiol reductant ABC exporter subunit CydC n=1 Tax=Metasolibacillus sp. TaxID=2703680 RepID=UPI0025EEEB49|nr:thiol reductant ABC exporter subunit CydC [Metasolibacillus sp.]MCT6925046.1 thiol reductant ABC exporter subunit CydC [Metasolibacillus sp.]MCT6941261.1 thiol reductant ABC exporter subunit CydC [Metasolibacillus sp.]
MWQMILSEKRDFLLALLAGTISGLTAVALFAQSGFLISKAALLPPFYIILILTAFLKLFGVAKSASKYAERYISHRVTFSLLEKIRLRFFQSLQPYAHSLLSSYRGGDLLTRMTKDVDTLQQYFLRVAYPPLVALLVFFGTMLFTIWFSIWITLLLLVSVILCSIILPLLWQKPKEITSQQHYTESLTEYFYGLTDLTVAGKRPAAEQALQQLSLDFEQNIQNEEKQALKSQLVNQATALSTAFAVVILGAYFVTTGALDGLYLAMLLLIALTVFEVAIPLGTVPLHKAKAKDAFDRLTAFNAAAISTQALPQGQLQTVQANNVSYRYPNSDFQALQDISFTINAGEKIAIVGPSGAGKSTLFQLLIQNLQPSNGEILWNGDNTAQIQHEQLWSQMGIMLQHNHFFSGTIKENLLSEKEAGQMEQLLEQLQLPFSLEQEVLENARNLSGGEQQRLALARVLLRDAPIYLLDEPFAHLDGSLTTHCTELLLTLPQTVICITHKLDALALFDRIFVIYEHQLVEADHYDELIKKQGIFYHMQQLK